MVFELTSTFVGPTVKCVNNTLEAFLGHIIPQRTVVKCDVEDTVDVISNALILPKHIENCCDCSKGMLGPSEYGSIRARETKGAYIPFTGLHKLDQKFNYPMSTQTGKDTCLLKSLLRSWWEFL